MRRLEITDIGVCKRNTLRKTAFHARHAFYTRHAFIRTIHLNWEGTYKKMSEWNKKPVAKEIIHELNEHYGCDPLTASILARRQVT